MEKRLSILSLAIILVLGPLAPAVRAQNQADDKETAKIKSEITKRVNKDKNRVKIKMRDGAEFKARITQAGENSFTATDEKTGKQTELAYSDVAKVNGRGMSKGLKIGIIAGAAVVTLAIIAIIAIKNFDPFEGGVISIR